MTSAEEDTGFNGSKVIKTPHLDQMAAEGLQLIAFIRLQVSVPPRVLVYSQVATPTVQAFPCQPRFPPSRRNRSPRSIKEQGYATGHFGKWHLGTLTHTEKDANRGKPGNTKEFNPPKMVMRMPL